MSITTLTSSEFNQDTSRAKKAANEGPVFITDRGRPAHVLLSIEQYQTLVGRQMTLAEALNQPDGGDFDLTRRASSRGIALMFVLDTNVVAELRRLDRAHPKVAAWASSVPLAGMLLSAMTILEIELVRPASKDVSFDNTLAANLASAK